MHAKFCFSKVECRFGLVFFMLRGGAEVARQAHNLKVVGSIPTPATIYLASSLAFFFLITLPKCNLLQDLLQPV